MFAIRDNPVSIADGDPTAPKVKPLALDTFHSVVTLPTSGTELVITGLGSVDMLNFVGDINALSTSNGAEDLRLSFSDDGGATWASPFTISSAIFTGSGEAFAAASTHWIGLRSGLFLEPSNANSGAAVITLPSGTVNAIKYFLNNGKSAFSGTASALITAPGVSS
jgi:hypothetical protein